MELKLVSQLDQIAQSGPNVFLKLNPEIVDFTKSAFSVDLIFITKSKSFAISLNQDNVIEIISLIKAAVLTDKLLLITWNIKNLFTLVKFKTESDLEFENKILDLKIIEAYFGKKDKVPDNFTDVVNRVRVISGMEGWGNFKNLYNKFYIPLITRVIPSIETEGIFDNSARTLVYPYYEIEGQVNGRLACQLAYERCFNPHSLTDERKAFLLPKNNELTFLYFDYKYIEVCILAWLSKDARLMDLTSQEEDFYKELFKILFNKECDTDIKRTFCKGLFLPLVFGQSAGALAKMHNLEIDLVKKLISKLKDVFPQVFHWVEDYPSKNGVYEDYFGRKREFNQVDEYKYRNFIIQSPAALFYIEQLVKLFGALQGCGKIVAHIHDGYLVYAQTKQAELVKIICMESLNVSEMLPGLKLRLNYKISNNLT